MIQVFETFDAAQDVESTMVGWSTAVTEYTDYQGFDGWVIQARVPESNSYYHLHTDGYVK